MIGLRTCGRTVTGRSTRSRPTRNMVPPAATASALPHRSASNAGGARAAVLSEPKGRTEGPGQDFVSRSSLVRRLTNASGAKLAVIVAPPGYGKSGLLREWSQRDQRRFLWLTPADLEIDDSGSTATADTLAAAISSLRAEAGQFVLALDDAHLVAPELLRDGGGPGHAGATRWLDGRSGLADRARAPARQVARATEPGRSSRGRSGDDAGRSVDPAALDRPGARVHARCKRSSGGRRAGPRRCTWPRSRCVTSRRLAKPCPTSAETITGSRSTSTMRSCPVCLPA